MHSPDNILKQLQGASCTTGGILCGRAHGNVFNFADARDVLDQGPQQGMALRGCVYIYTSPLNPTTLDPEQMKPMATVKVTTSQSIAPMLQQVTHQFSPVRSKYTLNIMLKFFFLTFVLENNRHIYVLENSVWDLKGRYDMAVEEDDDLDWVKVNDENVVCMLVVCNYFVSMLILTFFFSQSSYEDQSEVLSYQSPLYDSKYTSLSAPKTRSDSKTPSTVNGPSQDPKKAYTAHLMKELNIPSHLVDRSDTSLYMGYKKYKAIVAATHAASEITWDIRSQPILR